MGLLLYFIIPLYIIIFSKQINIKKFNIFDFVLITIMIFICGFRKNVGTDFLLYSRMYNNISIFPRVEIGFKYLINFMSGMGLSSFWFFFLTSSLTILIVYYIIKKISDKPSESLFLFITLGYFSLQFNIIRQCLAIAVSLYSIKFIIKKDFFKYFVCILMASLFHTTALIMFPFYFISKINISKKRCVEILIILFIVSLMYNQIICLIVRYFPTYEVYLTINNYTYDAAGVGSYLIILFNLLLFSVILINKSKLVKYNKNNNIYINMILFSFFYYFLSLNNTVMIRPGYYLSISFIFILPDLYQVNKKKLNDKNSIIFVVIFIIYYLFHILFFNNMLPYNNVLF